MKRSANLKATFPHSRAVVRALHCFPGRQWAAESNPCPQSFLIGGYIPIRSTGVGVGALLVGHTDSEGRLQFAGRVGSGFTNKGVKELLASFEPLRRTDNPFAELPIASARQWKGTGASRFVRNEKRPSSAAGSGC